MIKTIGRGGPKVIQLDIKVPPPIYEPTEEELKIMQLRDDMNQIQERVARGELDGIWDQAKDMLYKAKKAMNKITGGKDTEEESEKPRHYETPVHHPVVAPPHASVELPAKLYEELELIINLLIALVNAMNNANAQTQDADSTPSPPDETPQAETASPMVYVIRRSTRCQPE